MFKGVASLGWTELGNPQDDIALELEAAVEEGESLYGNPDGC